MKSKKIRIITAIAMIGFLKVCDASPSLVTNTSILICPQHVSGIFGNGHEQTIIQHGEIWSYAPFPYSESAPAITLKDVNTTNQIKKLDPKIILHATVYCVGQSNGKKFVFAKAVYQNYSPAGLIFWMHK